tara:strand:- start:365 stop:613 length:249 start_codon:yes stop_codon:yes gene_type:complete
MSLANGTKSLIRAAFMPAAAIIFAVALYFTGMAVQAGEALKTDNTAELKSVHGLTIAAAVTAWIAYVMAVVGAIISGKQAKL